jgi:riboflavin synthase
VCLTVVRLEEDSFTADVMPETVRLTNIGSLRPGDRVNLERTLRLCDGLDGHIVSGHVEGLGMITAERLEGIARVVTINTTPDLLKYIIKKGSIAIDGISLTVTEVTENGFSVSLIPHTAKETTLGFKRVGDSVNLETDIIGKYVERMLQQGAHSQVGEQGLDRQLLLENGFL